MIYPLNFETKIGFNTIRKELKELCLSVDSKIIVDEISFSSDYKNIVRELNRVSEMVKSLKETDDTFRVPVGSLPIESLQNIFKTLSIDGSCLSIDNFQLLKKELECSEQNFNFFHRNDPKIIGNLYPELNDLGTLLTSTVHISREIDRIFTKEGEIKNNASRELAEIRQKLSESNKTVATVMRRIMSRAVENGAISTDTMPVVRDGRLVLPVVPMHKKQINGIVHDESATGRTIYVEPSEVVEVNNRIRELELEEKREILRILTFLTDSIRPSREELINNHHILCQLDFTHAKARYANSVGAQLPKIHPSPEIEWYHAIHPLLYKTLSAQNKTIVPLDITLTNKDRILIISGPNAGGKSVCLKTVGLLQYMMQCGLLPSLYSNSHMGIFDNLFIDIGDDQSLEDDLSTYSSHLRNMKTFLNKGNNRSLVLIDEFGAGTEPTIGGALAQAVLEELNRKGCWGVITTHYQNLKLFADNTEGLTNGSMLYDRHLMQPLFTLSIGNPGSSFALEIAQKTGLPASIIDEATKLVGTDYVNADKFLLDINRDKKYWEKKRTDIKLKEKKLDKIIEDWENDSAALKEQRKNLIKEAKQEAEKILAQTNSNIEKTIKGIKESQAEKSATRKLRQELEDFRQKLVTEYEAENNKLLNKRTRKRKNTSEKSTSKESKTSLDIGDIVLLDNQGIPGEVIEINGKKAKVNFGLMKTEVSIERLKPTNRKPSKANNSQSSYGDSARSSNHERRMKFKPDIDLRGMRVDEALQAVTYFIDDAVQFGAERVRLLHGTGTGALKQAIRQYLKTVPHVSKFMDEDVRFGGAGITVVNLT